MITTGNPNPSLNVPNLPAGSYVFVRVRAQLNDTTSTPSSELKFYLQDYKHFVEALVLGTGPYADGGASRPKRFSPRGWSPGTTVRIRVSNTVTPAQRRGLETVAAQLAQSGAPYRATFEMMDSNQAFFVRNEIQVVTLANACGTGGGCNVFADTTLAQNPASVVFGSVAVFLGVPGEFGDNAHVAAHEMGHALFGATHVGYAQLPEAPRPGFFFGTIDFPLLSMGTGAFYPSAGLTDLELQAYQDVFRAGISAGARRSDLAARGLIH